MKARKRKHEIMRNMDDPSWDYFISRTTMYKTRDIKPCKSYSKWCADCNAVLFRNLMGRFPHTMQEFDEFENKQQETP
jgi:hypothetical protein